MSQGIVKVKPKPAAQPDIVAQPGTVETGSSPSTTLNFWYPGFEVSVGQTVEYTIDARNNAFCVVTRIIQPPKHHGHDAPPVPADENQQ
jgi:hypothetical protein